MTAPIRFQIEEIPIFSYVLFIHSDGDRMQHSHKRKRAIKHTDT